MPPDHGAIHGIGGEHLSIRQGLERQGGYKRLGVRTQNDAHLCASTLQSTQDIDGNPGKRAASHP
jgi:hypothetical protein